jgi:ribonuclease E
MCQVPVEVASFLLNEKRTEIAKIELKQRVNVLMVPNKTLETNPPQLQARAPQARRPAPGQHRSQLQAGRRPAARKEEKREDPTAVTAAARRSPPTSRPR